MAIKRKKKNIKLMGLDKKMEIFLKN